MKADYDIAIVGAGMVGASFAAALLEQAQELGWRIALLEPQPLENSVQAPYQPSFDSRSTALAYGSASIYQQLAVWEALSVRAQPIEHIHVSDRGHFGAARLHASEERVPALGYVVENKWLGQVLQQHLQSHRAAGCLDYLSGAVVSEVVRVDEQMQLRYSRDDSEHQLCAELVVMADGGRSALRQKLGISYSEQSYQQHALICNVGVDRAHGNIAYERFTSAGPMALLPLADEAGTARMALVWTTPEDEIEARLALDEAAFLAQLQEAFGYRAGRFVQLGERFSYPLKLQRASEQVRPGLAVVGNAAHALHPIAGQGFNLALRGVAELAAELFKSAHNGESLGDYSRLLAYQEARLSDQRNTIGFSDKSMKLFAMEHRAVILGRDLGLGLMDVCQPLKTLFSRSAMGLASPAVNFKVGEKNA
ncbi:MAG: 2-octaprenyl-6-methoxyphenyl hydroxylase [Pseudomonadales bacterium]